MLFRSKAPGHMFIARPEIASYEMGYKVIKARQLEADFGQDFGSEYPLEDVHNFGGGQFATANIVGGVFDSLTAQKANNWSDEERVIVEQRIMEQYCVDGAPHRGDVWVYEPPRAAPPWPRYDETHHNSVANLAEQLGLVQEAIIYEQRSKNREVVLLQLKEKLAKAEAEKTLVAQP